MSEPAADSPSPSFASLWSIPEDVTYLNHGSFGPTPRAVQAARQEWSQRLANQPMDFFLRGMAPALDDAAGRLAQFVGADARDLVFVDNATTAMNTVAETVPLNDGDEVLLNNHEYGAVRRIWQRKCDERRAKLVTAQIAVPMTSPEDIVNQLFAAVTDRTRLIVVSHVTSPTAIVFPVKQICQRARERQIAVCIDGPHAIAMRDVKLNDIRADFYCASLHKWLSAPLGSGFLHVDRRWQSRLRSPFTSWGRSLAGGAARWQDEWNWQGTRDPANFLAVPAAIDLLESFGRQRFRDYGHELARAARQRLEELCGSRALVPDDPAWYGTMITIPLPEGPSLRTTPNSWDPWTRVLWERHRIEIPIIDWNGRRHIRVSCHLYNTQADLDQLLSALGELLRE